MYNSYQTPEGMFFIEEEEGNGSQTIQTLTVPNAGIVPAECYEHSAEFVDLQYTTLMIFSFNKQI